VYGPTLHFARVENIFRRDARTDDSDNSCTVYTGGPGVQNACLGTAVRASTLIFERFAFQNDARPRTILDISAITRFTFDTSPTTNRRHR